MNNKVKNIFLSVAASALFLLATYFVPHPKLTGGMFFGLGETGSIDTSSCFEEIAQREGEAIYEVYVDYDVRFYGVPLAWRRLEAHPQCNQSYISFSITSIAINMALVSSIFYYGAMKNKDF